MPIGRLAISARRLIDFGPIVQATGVLRHRIGRESARPGRFPVHRRLDRAHTVRLVSTEPLLSSNPESSPFTPFTRPDILTPSKPTPKTRSPSKKPSRTTSEPDTQLIMPSRIYKSSYPDVPLPPPCSIFHYNFPHRNLQQEDANGPKALKRDFEDSSPGYVDAASGDKYTRSELFLKSRQLGLALEEHFKGSTSRASTSSKGRPVILIFSPNSISYPLIFFGCQSVLFITTLANAGYTSSELAHQILDSGATGAFIHPDLVSVYGDAVKIVSEKKGGKEQAEKLRGSTWLAARRKDVKEKNGLESFEALVDSVDAGKARGWEGKKVGKGGEHETAILCYSSGTTGLAKGVMTSHHNLTSVQTMVRPINDPLSPQAGDAVLGVLPFYHIYGLVVVLLNAFTQGVPVIVLPRFEPSAFLGAVQKYKITYANIVPPIVVFLANSPMVDQYDLKSLKVCMSGAAPLGDGLVQKATKRIGFTIVQGYGLTETSPITHMLRVEEATAHPGSIGRLIPNMSARIIDIDGNDVEPGMPGEIIFKGPNVMKGYLNNEKATKGTFTEDGWYRTGDIAQIDKDGFYFIVDRLKELIKYKGFQVPPADLEAVLLTHPKVADVGVVGIMDEEQATEVPLAYIVPVGGLESLKSDKEKQALSKEIVDWTAKTVSKHKQLRGGVVLIDAIPKSAAGKILRRELRLHAAKNAKAKKPVAKL